MGAEKAAKEQKRANWATNRGKYLGSIRHLDSPILSMDLHGIVVPIGIKAPVIGYFIAASGGNRCIRWAVSDHQTLRVTHAQRGRVAGAIGSTRCDRENVRGSVRRTRAADDGTTPSQLR